MTRLFLGENLNTFSQGGKEISEPHTLLNLQITFNIIFLVLKEFPPSDEELEAYRNGEVCSDI